MGSLRSGGDDALSRGNTLLDLGRVREAIEQYSQGLQRSPGDPLLLGSIGRAHLALNNTKVALQWAEKAIAAAPDEEYGHRMRSIVLQRMGKHKKALESAQMALSMAPEAPMVLYQLFRAAQASGKKKIVEETVERMLEISPGLVITQNAAGLSLLETNARLAEKHFRAALEIDPESVDAMNNLGVALQKQGRREQAAELFFAAAKTDPMHKLAKTNLASAITPKLGFGIIVFVLLGQIGNLHDKGTPDWVVTILALLVIVIAIAVFWRWFSGRTGNYSPELAQYVRRERKQQLKRSVKRVALRVGLYFAIVMVIVVIAIVMAR